MKTKGFKVGEKKKRSIIKKHKNSCPSCCDISFVVALTLLLPGGHKVPAAQII